MPSFFLSIDGVDGAGKSTQIKLLQDWYASRGIQPRVVRDPGGTLLGEAVREILLHRKDIPLGMTAEMLLYMASRAQLVAERIQPALEAGEVVISDRYLLANVVYQGAAGGLDPETIWQVGSIATSGLSPDLTIILDLDVTLAQQRLTGEPDRLESRGVDFMAKVRTGFIEQSRRLGNRAVLIDASQSVEAIHTAITKAITERR